MFSPSDVQAVMDGTATRGQVLAVLTSQTCGEACWHAREEICRCSCGGKNHGCLTHGGTAPERTSKIDGHLYRLKAVGLWRDLAPEACEINRLAGFSYVERPIITIDSMGASYTEADAAKAKAAGQEVAWVQYKGTWRTTDSGAPARLKTASKPQRNWRELNGWKEEREVYLLWERVQMPERPSELVVDKDTGQPLEKQLPKHCHA